MKSAAIMLYGLMLHALAGYIAWTHPHLGPRLATALGCATAQPMEAETFIAMIRDVHGRMDPMVPEEATVFLGDSITMCLAVAVLVPYGVNYGIGWQRSDQLLASMDFYPSLKRAARVVVTIGTNDLLQNRAEGIISRYRAILDRIPPTTTIVMSSIPPIHPSVLQDRMIPRDRVHELVASARAVCEADRRCSFVDAQAALSAQGLPRPEVLTADGVHLTPQGYSLWIEALRAAISARSGSTALSSFDPIQ